MPLNRKERQRKTQRVVIFPDTEDEFWVDMRPSVMTLDFYKGLQKKADDVRTSSDEGSQGLAVMEALARDMTQVIASWDINDDGAKVEVTPEELIAMDVPLMLSILSGVMQAGSQDTMPGEQRQTSADGQQPGAMSARSQVGTGSFELPTTTALIPST